MDVAARDVVGVKRTISIRVGRKVNEGNTDDNSKVLEKLDNANGIRPTLVGKGECDNEAAWPRRGTEWKGRGEKERRRCEWR